MVSNYINRSFGTVNDLASGNGGSVVGTFTLSTTVNGSGLDWHLSFDGYVQYSVATTGEARFFISAGNDNTQIPLGSGGFTGGSWSGTLYPEISRGTITVEFDPAYPCGFGGTGPNSNLMVSDSYSGISGGSGTSYSDLYADVSIPPAIGAGGTISVVCQLGGPTGVTGKLDEYLSSGGANFRKTRTISSTLTGPGTQTFNVDIPLDYGGKTIQYYLTVSYGNQTITDASAAVAITPNYAPSTPEYLTIPSSISGGSSIQIEWGESTDANGNLAGYILERSVNGGNAWTEIYRGPSRSTVNYIEDGTARVRYQVKAYDTFNVESGYCKAPSSGDVIVNNNHAPYPPSAITVSPLNPVIGSEIVINWEATTDPDGDDFDYVLERAVNGSSTYEAIYTGKNTSKTETCGSWSTVTYRVKAVDIHGAASGYKEIDAPRTVISNSAPTITCTHADNADLGTKTSAFSFTYSVNDANTSDTLTVKESIDGTVKKTINNAVREKNYTFNFRTGSSASTSYWTKLSNGTHTITISVTDGTTTVSRSFDFIKNVDACLITLTNAIDSVNDIELAIVSICGSIPTGGLTSVRATANNGTNWTQCKLADNAGTSSGIGNRKKIDTGILNEELLGGHYLFIAEIPSAERGKKFNFQVQVQKVQISGEDVGGYISSVQGAFVESVAT